jgi:hypothetical protein
VIVTVLLLLVFLGIIARGMLWIREDYRRARQRDAEIQESDAMGALYPARETRPPGRSSAILAVYPDVVPAPLDLERFEEDEPA